MADEHTPTTEDVRLVYGSDRDGWPDGRRLEAFSRWLAAHDAETAARAWDEGYTAGYVDASDDRDPESPNPYREGGAS